jgi:hypothetical protein
MSLGISTPVSISYSIHQEANQLNHNASYKKIRSVLSWRDFNEVKDPETGKKVFNKDKQLFFVVAPLN